MALATFTFPTRIEFGPGALARLPDVLAEAGARRPLIVTDRGLAPLPPVARARDLCVGAGLWPAVFSGVWGNPVKSQVLAGVEALGAHDADAVVGLGGGAAIDVAKAILVMARHPGDLFDYEDGVPGARPIDGEILPFVTIPTTAGTGSEVGRSTVISDDATKVKKIVYSPRLLARRVLCDPDLTLALPAAVTAATGMDAATHLIESYLAKDFHPLCDGIAIEGLRLLARSLGRAVECARRIDSGDRGTIDDPAHREARSHMMIAALMGGIAFQKGLGVTHSCAHALSTACDLHHGLANGVMLPYAMTFNASAAPADGSMIEARFCDLAAAVAAVDRTAAGFLEWIRTLRAAIGIPHTLSEAGVDRGQLARLVALAAADSCHLNNPRPVTPADLRGIFERALAGAAS